jgi:hypothetical protein
MSYLYISIHWGGGGRHAVVWSLEALCYKPSWIPGEVTEFFSNYLILPAALRPWFSLSLYKEGVPGIFQGVARAGARRTAQDRAGPRRSAQSVPKTDLIVVCEPII